MDKLLEEVNTFFKEYEVATNSHIFENVRPLIAEDAIYWFSDGTHVGISEIEDDFLNLSDCRTQSCLLLCFEA